MATTYQDTTGNGSNKVFNFGFPYLKDADVKVQINQVQIASTEYAVSTGPTKITFNNNSINSAVQETDGSPKTGLIVRVYRDTDVDTAKAVFASGSSVKASDLNNNQDQFLYAAQEQQNLTVAKWQISADAIDGTKIGDDSIDSEHYVDGSIDTAHIADAQITTAKIATDAITGSKIKDGEVNSEHFVTGAIDTGHIGDGQITTVKIADSQITTAKIATGAVTGSKIGNNEVNSEHFVNGSIDTSHIGDGQVTTAKIEDSGVTTVKIAADAVTGAKIADDSIDSEHYVDGSIDTAHLADNSVTGAKLAAGTIGTSDLADSGVTTAKIADLNVTTAKIAADAITGAKIADDVIDSEHYAAGSIDLEHMSANSVDSDQYVDGSIDTAHIADSQITTAKIAADAVDGTKIADNAIGSEHIAANAVTTSEIADAELTTLAGMQSGTASILAGGTALTADLSELNMLDGKTIVTTISGSPTDAQLPTAQAVDERITTVVTDVGGFVPIANETSFPTTNPDINNGAGTIVSIKALASAITTGSGVTTKTIANGAGSGNTVTINGLAENTTYPAGRGMLVETTSTLHTYTYHRLTLDEAGVADAQTAINDFNARYRVHNGEPSSSLDDGDLVWDTNANKMKVYDATASTWSEVTSTGDFKFLVPVDAGTTTAATWDGSDTSFDLKETTNSGSAASISNVNQLIVSLNGVIQKPNTGSYSASEEGFYLTDTDTIRFCTAPPSGSTAFILQIGSAVSIPTPGDNTVATAKIQNLAVTTAKIAADAIDGTKLADDAIDSEHYTDGSIDLAHMSSESVDEDNLKISNAGTNGQYLQKQSGNAGGLTWADVPAGVGGATGVDFNDNVKVRWGTGNDLEMYYSGSEGFIKQPVGTMWTESPAWVVTSSNGGETMARFTENGSCDLYYDNSKKVETTNTGIKISGSDGGGSEVFGDMYWDNASNAGKDMHWDQSNNKLSLSDDVILALGGASDSGDLKIYHKSSDNGNYIECENSRTLYYQSANHFMLDEAGNEYIIKGIANGAVELYYNNSKKLETDDDGVTITGTLRVDQTRIGDSEKAYFGNDLDLSVYHDGTDGYIKESDSGRIRLAADEVRIENSASGETMAKFLNNGACELRYDDALAFQTATNGAIFYGTEGSACEVKLYADEGDDYADKWLIQATAAGALNIYNNDGSWQERVTMSATGGSLKGSWSGAGKILQVKKANLGSDLNTGSTSWTDVGLSETITLASTSNYIYIVLSTTPYIGGGSEERFRLIITVTPSGGSATTVLEDNYWCYRTGDDWKSSSGHHDVYYHPNSTAELTINVQTQRQTGGDNIWLGRHATDMNTNTLTVMEVGA